MEIAEEIQNEKILDNGDMEQDQPTLDPLHRNVERPKKPLTPYQLFAKEERLTKKGLTFTDISWAWREMAPQEKTRFVHEAEILQKEYFQKMEAFRKYLESREDKDDPLALPDLGDGDNDDQNVEITLFPYSRLKRLLKMGSSTNSKIKKAVIGLVQEAIQEFASDLIKGSIAAMNDDRKKKLKDSHLLSALKKNRKYEFLLESNIFNLEDINAVEKQKKKKRTYAPKDKHESGIQQTLMDIEEVLQESPRSSHNVMDEEKTLDVADSKFEKLGACEPSSEKRKKGRPSSNKKAESTSKYKSLNQFFKKA